MASSFEKTTDDVDGRKQNSRYSDIGDLPKQELLPISGYQDSELLPLKQAVQFIDELPRNISEKIQIALNNCSHPREGLTPDESAAIHIYTMEWHPHYRCLYYLLNQKLRLENRYLLKPWFKYLKLIITALYKLPSCQGTHVLDFSSKPPVTAVSLKNRRLKSVFRFVPLFLLIFVSF